MLKYMKDVVNMIEIILSGDPRNGCVRFLRFDFLVEESYDQLIHEDAKKRKRKISEFISTGVCMDAVKPTTFLAK
jgi:hypothetical protein